MRRVSATIALCAALALLILGPARGSADARSTTAATPAVSAVNDLGLAMLDRLDNGQDAVVSPLSVATALAMVDQGASGQTAAQLDRLLGRAGSPAAVATSFAALRGELGDAVGASGGPTLASADALWLQSGLRLLPAFARSLSASFSAPAQSVAFTPDPAGAIATINHWASQHTGGRIPSLMSPAEVSDQTELVLANAIYLNARWQTPFDPRDTHTADFSTPTGRVSVPFMSAGDLRTPFGAGSGYRAVALPYAHSTLQFLAVMPTNGTISTFTHALSAARLSRIVAGMADRNLQLALPKFTLAFHADLNGLLQGLGLRNAFGPGAELNRMVTGRDLQIQSVVHAATLQVAEKGTVAAAATGVSLAPTAVAAASLRLTLDHPFLVFIRDARTGAVLFAARVMNPAS